jgi:hypothetical protein
LLQARPARLGSRHAVGINLDQRPAALCGQLTEGQFLDLGILLEGIAISVENELLREKIARLEDGRPLALWKSKP